MRVGPTITRATGARAHAGVLNGVRRRSAGCRGGPHVVCVKLSKRLRHSTQLLRRVREEARQPITESCRARPASGCTGCRRRWPRSSGTACSARARPGRPAVWRAAHISSSDEYDGRSQFDPHHAQLPQHSLRHVRPWHTRVGTRDRRRHTPIKRGGTGHLEHAARSRPDRGVVGEEIRRTGASTKSGPPLCAS